MKTKMQCLICGGPVEVWWETEEHNYIYQCQLCGYVMEEDEEIGMERSS